MKKSISLILAFAMLLTLLPNTWQVRSSAAEAKTAARDATVFVDGVYTLALAAEGSASDYADGSVRRVLDMAMPGSSQSLLELNCYTGESSQQFIIRQYSKDAEYYMIQSVSNQGYLGYNGFDGKKAEVKRYGQIDNNAEEYLWKPIANGDGSWSFAPMNAYTAADLSAWNLRLGVTDTKRGSVGTLAALVPTDADSAMQHWFLQPCNILTDTQETAFQIIVSQEASGKTYATDNIGGTVRGAWDGLPTNLSAHNPNSKSQKFLFERVEPENLQAYQNSADYRAAVAQSGGGYYAIREISNSEYLTVGADGKLILCETLTDGGLWTVFPNWSQNNQSEAAIADTYSLVSYANGNYYSVSTQLSVGDLGSVNTDGMLEAREYAYDEANPFRQYWKLTEAARNPGTVTDGGTDLTDGSFGTEALTLPIKLYDFASDNMLFEFDSYWPNWGNLQIGTDAWRKGTNPAFSLQAQGTAVSNTDLSAYDALDGYRLLGTQTGGYLGLVEHSLSDQLPTYRQEVVEALAATLQETLAIPYRNADSTINNTYLSGEANGERYGYENGEARDLAQWLRVTIPTDGNGAYVLGSYAETAQKRSGLLTAWDTAQGSIRTCMDAAYFLLNSLFVADSYNEYQTNYQYLQLGKAVNAEGKNCYVFDSALGDENQESSVVYADQTISNSSAATRPLYNGNAKYPFLPITDKNNEQGMTKYESPLYESLRSLEQYGQTYYCRNYSYALACNSSFVYRETEDLFFTFAGNDDAYLFINGELVMDMGGTHSAAEASIKLNDYVRAARENVAAAKAARKEPSARDTALALESGKAYSFDFYYLQRMGPEANLRVETNIAVGDVTEYTVKYLPNGGEGTMEPQTCITDKDTKLADCTFTREGYTFKGWYLYKLSTDASCNATWLYAKDDNGTVQWAVAGEQSAEFPDFALYDNQCVFSRLAWVDGDVVYAIAQWEPVDKAAVYATIPDGIYKINSADTNTSENAKDRTRYYVTAYECAGDGLQGEVYACKSNQRFVFTKVDDYAYLIRVAETDLYLTLNGSGSQLMTFSGSNEDNLTENRRVALKTANGSMLQKWYLLPGGVSGSYIIQSAADERCRLSLNAHGIDTVPLIIAWAEAGRTSKFCNENWTLTPVSAAESAGHSYTYTDNGDGTHTKVCANCGDTITETHTFTDGVCICGAVESTEPTVDSAISIGQQLFLESDLSLTFRIKESQLTNYDVSTAYLVVERDIYPTGGEMYVKTDMLTEYTIENSRLVFVYSGIAAAQMNDEIRVTLHIKDSNGKDYVSNTLVTSVTAYAKLLFDAYGTTNAKLCTVLMDMLNYGTAAQLYFDRHVDAPANTAYAEFADYASYASTDFVTPLEDLSSVLTNEGATAAMTQSVDLSTRVGIIYKVTLPNGVNAADATVVVKDADGNALETLRLADGTVDSKGRYVVTYYGTPSRLMRRVVCGTVYVGDTLISNTYGYSISTYAYQIANTAGMPEALVNLTNLMVMYGDAANAYFGG